MSHAETVVILWDHYRQHIIKIHQVWGEWRYECRLPHSVDWFSDGRTYDKPLSARTAARYFINMHCTLLALGDTLQEWVEANHINHQEYQAATSELIELANELLF